MTLTRTVRLTCDRCGVETTHDDADGHRPRDWERIAFSVLIGDLCPSCAVHIADAMRAPDAPPPPPPPVSRLTLTIEDRARSIDDADDAIRAAIVQAVAEFRAQPTRMLDPNAFADVLADTRPHATTVVDRILARVKERPHG